MRNEELLEALKEQAKRVLKECEVTPPFDSSLLLHLPSGDRKYRSFWIRDAAMMAESGLIEADELKGWITYIISRGINLQEALILDNHLVVPSFTVADHLHFEYGAIFFPGPDTGVRNQGNGTYGFYPPLCDNYYFIEMMYLYTTMTQDMSFLKNHLWLLENVFTAHHVEESTRLCVSESERHVVDFGFCDTVVKSGFLLFASLLRYRAAIRMKRLCHFSRCHDIANKYEKEAMLIKNSILYYFYDGTGWLLSATGTGRQKDLWGTAFAMWLHILPEKYRNKSAKVLLNEYTNKNSVYDGYLRHIPKGEEYSSDSCWEKASCTNDTYQNGGYWATPLGWFAYGISFTDKKASVAVIEEFLAHTLTYQQQGAPFEWKSKDTSIISGCQYGTSAVFPYLGLKRMMEENGEL